MFLGGAVVYVLSMTQEAETEVKQAAPQLAPCAVRTAPVIGTIHGKRSAAPLRDHESALLRRAKSQVPELRRRAAGGHVRGDQGAPRPGLLIRRIAPLEAPCGGSRTPKEGTVQLLRRLYGRDGARRRVLQFHCEIAPSATKTVRSKISASPAARGDLPEGGGAWSRLFLPLLDLRVSRRCAQWPLAGAAAAWKSTMLWARLGPKHCPQGGARRSLVRRGPRGLGADPAGCAGRAGELRLPAARAGEGRRSWAS